MNTSNNSIGPSWATIENQRVGKKQTHGRRGKEGVIEGGRPVFWAGVFDRKRRK